MNAYVPTPAALGRFRILCLVMLGAFALMLVQIVQDLLMLLLTAPKEGIATMSFALTAVEFVGVAFAAGLAVRFVRTSKLPGVVSLVALVALIWAMALVGHYS